MEQEDLNSFVYNGIIVVFNNKADILHLSALDGEFIPVELPMLNGINKQIKFFLESKKFKNYDSTLSRWLND